MFEWIDSGGAGGHWGRWPAVRFARRVALGRGLAAGLTDHLGCGRGGSAPPARPSTGKQERPRTVDPQVGPFGTGGPQGPGGLAPRRGGWRKGTAPTRSGQALVVHRCDPPGGMTVRGIGHHLAPTIGAASERGRSQVTDAVRPGAVQRAAHAGLRRPSFPVVHPGRDPRPWPRADHQGAPPAVAALPWGAAVDGLLSTRGVWVQGR